MQESTLKTGICKKTAGLHYQKNLQLLQLLQMTPQMPAAWCPHINKIASFSTQTAILHYQKTAEITEIAEKPWHNTITAVITASRQVWGLDRDAAYDG